MEPAELIVDYERPPVVETVVGVQFDPVDGLKNAHLGAFWKSLGSAWPNVSDAQTIEPQFERFDAAAFFPAGIRFQLSQSAASRLMIRNAAKDRLLQVQNGRLHVNWVGKNAANYLHYSRVRAEFDEKWAEFAAFVRQELQQECKANQWEVTYVNQIRTADGMWTEPGDWNRVVSLLGPGRVPAGPLESVSGEWHFVIKPNRGRLHVQLGHGIVEESKTQALTMKLTARGPIDTSKGWDIGSGLDLGHESIVKGFTSLTTVEAHQFWGKK